MNVLICLGLAICTMVHFASTTMDYTEIHDTFYYMGVSFAKYQCACDTEKEEAWEEFVTLRRKFEVTGEQKLYYGIAQPAAIFAGEGELIEWYKTGSMHGGLNEGKGNETGLKFKLVRFEEKLVKNFAEKKFTEIFPGSSSNTKMVFDYSGFEEIPSEVKSGESQSGTQTNNKLQFVFIMMFPEEIKPTVSYAPNPYQFS